MHICTSSPLRRRALPLFITTRQDSFAIPCAPAASFSIASKPHPSPRMSSWLDVLRSFSTAAYAFTAGAAAIHPVETAAEAIELQQALPT